MKCIAITNQKGGVGKTTVAANLACSLAKKGFKTLIIDLDPQGHSSLLLADENETVSVNELFLDKNKNIVTVVVQAKNKQNVIDNLYIIPSNIKLAVIAEQVGLRVHKEKILSNHLNIARINNTFDFVIMDCPPTLGVLAINGIYVADLILIPTTYSRYALEGVADLFEIIKEVKETLSFNYLIVRNMFDSRNKKANHFVDTQLKPFEMRLAKTVIRKTESINKSQINGDPIYIFDKDGHGTKDFDSLTDDVLSIFCQERI